MRMTAAATVLGFAILLSACAGGEPAPGTGAAGNTDAAAAESTPAAAPAPSGPAAGAPAPAPASGAAPAPPAAAAPGGGAPQPYPSELAAHANLRVDCQQDSECAVKDVGNCCGRYDACVRADSQPDPAAVQAECAARGLVGICGFPVIESCVCTAGTCAAAPSDGTGPDQAVR